MNMQQGIMGSHASPDLWISAEKSPDQQNSGAHFVMLSSAEKNIFSRNPRENQQKSTTQNQKMSSAEPYVWILSSAEIFFSAEVRYTICVVEFRWKTKKLKSAFFFCNRFGVTGSQFSAEKKKQQISCPIIGRNDKKKLHKVCRDLFSKLIWDLNAKFWALDPTLLLGHGWHMWSGGTCLGNPWKIV